MQENTTNKERLYYDIGDVPETTKLDERFLTPFSHLNYLLNGLVFNRITLITSGTDNGKSTFSSQILIEAIKSGYKCFAFFGEDGSKEARDRIFRQFLRYSDSNFVYTPYIKNDGKGTNCGENLLVHDKFVEAQKFFKSNLYIYNNNLPADKDGIIEAFEKVRTETGCKVFLLDNVEMFDLDTDNENKGVKEICIALRRYAITKQVHILIIAHIKKIDKGVVRPDIFDVKGTSALTNVAKNIITIIRTDKLDKSTREYRAFAKVLEKNDWDVENADAVVEVRKTKGRGLGFSCLKFNKVSNSYYEIKKIGESDNDDGLPKDKNPSDYKPKSLYEQGSLLTPLTKDEEDDFLKNIF